jgi:hypothetical protein
MTEFMSNEDLFGLVEITLKEGDGSKPIAAGAPRILL